MKVLVTYGSKRGGTRGIAEIIGETLEEHGLDCDVLPAQQVETLADYDVVIVGGALYSNRWQKDARHFVRRHADDLRARHVWFFSSGPLDDSALEHTIPPTREVYRLMQLAWATEHVTFGGRLEKNARGLLAQAMAKSHAGDWRYPSHIRRWATEVALKIGRLHPHLEEYLGGPTPYPG